LGIFMFSLSSIFTSDVRFIPILWDESSRMNHCPNGWWVKLTNKM
jgi:hypothetical protein